MVPRRVLLSAAALAALAAPLAACSTSDGSSSPSNSEAAATGGSGEETTTTAASGASTTTAGSAGALEGTWNADARDLLAANMSRVGAPAMDCSGPATLTFNSDGTFSNNGQVTCSVRGVSGNGEFTSTGNYAVNGNQVTVSDAQTSGQLSVGSANVPFSPGLSNGTVTYQIDGSSLTLFFDGGSTTWRRG